MVSGMSNDLTRELFQVYARLPHLGLDDALILLQHLSAMQNAVTAHVQTLVPQRQQTDDRLLTVKEAAKMLGTTEGWMYDNADKLPFTMRLGPKQLRFSKNGLQHHLVIEQGLG